VAPGRPRTGVEALIGYAAPGFCIYRNQPFILLAQRWSARAWLISVLVGAALVVPRLLVTVPVGTLGPPADPLADLAAIFGGAHGSAWTSVPWLRDYADIAILLLVAIHTGHLVNQWRRLTVLPERLRGVGLIAPSLADPATFTRITEGFEQRFSSPWLDVGAAALAILLVVPIAGLPALGLYPGAGGPEALQRYASWWANPDSHPLAFAVLIVSFGIYLYLTFRHAAMGIVMLGLIKEAARTASHGGESWFGYSSTSEAAIPVIGEVRQCLYDVVISITLLASAFAVGNIYVTFPTALVATFLLPYVLVLDPLFLIIPAVTLNRALSRSWTRLKESATEEHRAAAEKVAQRTAEPRRRGGYELAEVLLIEGHARDQLEAVNALPRRIIDWGALTRALLVYFVPVLGLLVPLLDVLKAAPK